MQWIQRTNQWGETYYVETRGRYMIDKKVTDDRTYDGGRLVTAWTLYQYDPRCHFAPGEATSGFAPLSMHSRLKEAKAAIQHV